jgi:hypothetical protein
MGTAAKGIMRIRNTIFLGAFFVAFFFGMTVAWWYQIAGRKVGTTCCH